LNAQVRLVSDEHQRDAVTSDVVLQNEQRQEGTGERRANKREGRGRARREKKGRKRRKGQSASLGAQQSLSRRSGLDQREEEKTHENLVPNNLTDFEARTTRNAVDDQPAMETDGVTGGEDAELVLSRRNGCEVEGQKRRRERKEEERTDLSGGVDDVELVFLALVLDLREKRA
jgi:hypothetical protein